MKDNREIININHDVNNHLGIVLGYFELLIEKYPEIKNDSYSKFILQGIFRTCDLSRELGQACHKNKSEENESAKEGFILRSVQEYFINYAESIYKKLMEIYDINIIHKTTVIEENKLIYVNSAALLRLRENIISNAIAANATQIEISLEMKEHCVTVTYHDNGKGMSQEEVDKIMLSQHGDGKAHGIGTRSIIETIREHEYSVSYSSIKGEGTTVRILVPYFDNF